MKRLGLIVVLLPLVATACGAGGRSVAVVGPDGDQVLQTVVVAVRPGATTYDHCTSTGGPDNPARIPRSALHEDSRLIVYGAGCRLVDRPMPKGNVTIRLSPGIPVRLVLAEGYEFPPASLTLQAECSPVNRPYCLGEEFDFGLSRTVIPMGALRLPPLERLGERCLFDPGPKAADVLFPYPGEWRVQLSIMKYTVVSKPGSRRTSGSGVGMDDEHAVTITVAEREDLQTIALSPNPGAYRKILEDMRRDE